MNFTNQVMQIIPISHGDSEDAKKYITNKYLMHWTHLAIYSIVKI